MKMYLVEGWRGITYDKWWISEKKLKEIGDKREFETLTEVDVPDDWSPLLVQAAVDHAEIQFEGRR